MNRDFDIHHFDGQTFSSVPQGYSAFLLSNLMEKSKRDVIYIASSGKELEETATVLSFLNPNIEVLKFPSWDTVPYDRASPHASIVSKRLDTLSKLSFEPNRPHQRVIVTSIGAIIQKLPPKSIFLNAKRTYEVGGKFNFDDFLHYVHINGYVRVEQVMEQGEYALRGDIVDIFPSSALMPLRIDLFDDEIERIRTFDAFSQRTTGELQSYTFGVAGEVVLDENTIQNFRMAYREAFGAAGLKDELYESISNGVKYIGFENWLPFFYSDSLPTLFDYLPAAAVVVGQEVSDALESKIDAIRDHYTARLEALKISDEKEAVYRPVKPEKLYLSKEKFEGIIGAKNHIFLSAFSLPDSENVVNLQVISGRDFIYKKNISLVHVYEELKNYLTENAKLKRMICVLSEGEKEKFLSFIEKYEIPDIIFAPTYQDALSVMSSKKTALVILPVRRGFKSDELCVIGQFDILGERVERRQRKIKVEDFIEDISSLEIGELVVHVEHGLGRFMGLESITAGGAPHDCLKIVYKNDDKLFVPVENIELVSRYGHDDEHIELDILGGGAWEAKKKKVQEKIKEIAEGLIKVAAERQLNTAEIYPLPSEPYNDFCARFEYQETDDQLHAISDVIKDLSSGAPMDRLICGDVGFGKTEVALRGAFAVAMNGAQVAVIVPTTLLARQHYLNFKKRFEGLPVQVKMLSRLTTAKEASSIVEGLKTGAVDIVIGTHALLSEKIKFSNLGLLIVDEEQHFGVGHKEKLKKLKTGVHVLTLSATPIPRTLQLSLSGVKELSLIATPPLDRLAARTFVMPFDKVMIKEAILREKYRGGQTFFVCPRVSDIAGVERMLKALVPDLKIAVAHGQMSTRELEDVMTDFSASQYDLLLSTTIIESGIDMPSVNTMIVYRADMFGLSQLYQLRGRIGRAKIRGYCYLTTPEGKKLNQSALKRLNVLSALDTLGAGFSLASYDMDIRGAGNVLGTEQSGHIKDVGMALYHHMLSEEIARQKALMNNEKAADSADWSPQVITGIPVMIGENYVKDLGVRLGLYKRIGALKTTDEIYEMKAELVDRFGPLPSEVENLLSVVEIKEMCKDAGISKIEAGAKGILISFHNDTFAHVDKLIDLVNRSFGVIQIRPDQKLFVAGDLSSYQKRIEIIKKYVTMLKNL